MPPPTTVAAMRKWTNTGLHLPDAYATDWPLENVQLHGHDSAVRVSWGNVLFVCCEWCDGDKLDVWRDLGWLRAQPSGIHILHLPNFEIVHALRLGWGWWRI
jgi:hypothetical protein